MDESSEEIISALKLRLAKLDSDFKPVNDAYLADRASIVRTMQLMQTGSQGNERKPLVLPARSPLPTPVPRQETLNKYGSISESVRRAVLSMDGEFTRDDVLKKLREINPAVAERVSENLATLLWNLKTKENLIRVTQQGTGHVQSRYMKISA